ncbi:hypothetical protein B0H13DRAFT_1898872 [Mycena leptocephala]|nr:hypothetical protein B0H13DRAFT_1898872 [Mycena leptocephala]
MLAEVEKPEFRLVILGKKDTAENSSGMSKAAAFKAIGKIILRRSVPSMRMPLQSGVYGIYKKQAKRLRQTGGGLGGNDDDEDESLHEYMSCYIPKEGPMGRRLLRQRISGYSSNVNPPVVITGVGPAGRKIVHLQPPAGSQGFPDHLIEPALMNLTATPRARRGSTPIPWSPSPIKTPPKRIPLKENLDPSVVKPKVKKETQFSEALIQARKHVKKIPAKRSLEDTLVSMHSTSSPKNTLKQTIKRSALQDQLAQRRLMLDEKAQLIEMQRLGIYTKDEFMPSLLKSRPSTQLRLNPPLPNWFFK